MESVAQNKEGSNMIRVTGTKAKIQTKVCLTTRLLSTTHKMKSFHLKDRSSKSISQQEINMRMTI